MKINVEIGGKEFELVMPGLDVSIPMHFDGPQPNIYGVPAATSKAFEGGGFVGDTRRGGGCNFETYTLTPHCNGTHTEAVGHIALERISVLDRLGESLVPATLIDILPASAGDSADSYDPQLDPSDKLIDRAVLEQALGGSDPAFHEAILIRTLPNDESKLSRNYITETPPFFSIEGMRYLVSLGVRHLLVDMPSVDRLFDEGKLSTHHIFWGVEAGSHEVAPEQASPRTITELIYVPDGIPAGKYLLDLQVAPFVSDAAPSRPRLYELKQKDA